MFRRLTLFAAFGALILTASSCAEEAPKEEEAPAPVAEAPKVEEGPFYELTKDDVTSHPDWTSMNIMLKGAKLGDKKLPEALGKGEKTDPVMQELETSLKFLLDRLAEELAQERAGKNPQEEMPEPTSLAM